jgi:GTPase SAR1 family protein
MIKYLFLFFLVACSEKKHSPRPEIERQQQMLMSEINRLKDSSANSTSEYRYELPEAKKDSIAASEAAVIKRINTLERRYDSLALIMKRYKVDSIVNK